jgi:alcohol dehydrogenase
MSSSLRYVMNTEIIFGLGSSRKLASVIAEQGGTKAFIVSDKGVEASGILDTIQADLRTDGVDFGLLDDIEQSSSVQSVDKGADVIRKEGYDIIIAVGGGSALDSGKAMGLVVGNGGKCRDYAAPQGEEALSARYRAADHRRYQRRGTDVAVIADREINARSGLRSNYISYRAWPSWIRCSRSASPPSVTAATGVDALSHAIESYTNTVSTTPTDLASLEAIRLIGKSLPAAVVNGKNIKAREDMCMACVLIGLRTAIPVWAFSTPSQAPSAAITKCPMVSPTRSPAPRVAFQRPGNYEKFAMWLRHWASPARA